ncbi:HNH endonuclease family protein [Streptomyces youssoufiensis]
MGMRIRAAIIAAVAVAATSSLSAPVAGAAPGETVETTVWQAIADLPRADEDRTGYTRDKFRHWVDADRDGCNTRAEVLIEEATTPPRVEGRCTLTGGTWHSYYDKKDHDQAGALDIDHMVPLAEAWDSGASQWTPKQRQDYANDLGDARALVAVTAAENRAKGDRDPAEWEPSDDEADCRYLADWVAVKTRWGLSADNAEIDALEGLASECVDEPMTVERAR